MIQQCALDLERLEHSSQITLKSDQEPAIVDVSSWVSWNAVGAFAFCRFPVEWVRRARNQVS